MMEQLDISASAPDATLPGMQLDDWLAAWPAVRREVEALLSEYCRLQPEYDPHWTDWVIGDVDSAIPNLTYRVAWLRRHIARASEGS